MNPYVVFDHLTIRLGKNVVLSDVTCEMERGLIHGICGRNGSGKTVLFKAICGFIPANAGRILIDGCPVRCFSTQEIGIILEEPGFLETLSARDNLRLLAGIKKRIGNKEVNDVLRAVNLDPTSKKPVKHYSLGMRHRLAIAQAIMENPPLLLLDEPMNGLDSQGVFEVKQLLRSLRNEGSTIIVTSHYLDDLSQLSDVLWKLEDGALSCTKSREETN